MIYIIIQDFCGIHIQISFNRKNCLMFLLLLFLYILLICVVALHCVCILQHVGDVYPLIVIFFHPNLQLCRHFTAVTFSTLLFHFRVSIPTFLSTQPAFNWGDNLHFDHNHGAVNYNVLVESSDTRDVVSLFLNISLSASSDPLRSLLNNYSLLASPPFESITL